MKVVSTFWGRLLSLGRSWSLELRNDAIHAYRAGTSGQMFPLSGMQNIASMPGPLGTSLTITVGGETWNFNRLDPTNAAALVARVLQTLRARAHDTHDDFRQRLEFSRVALDRLLSAPKYISHFDIESWKTNQGDLATVLREAAAFSTASHFPASRDREGFHRLINDLLDVVVGPRGAVAVRNSQFVDAELERHRSFFDSIESQPLTHEQRVASIVLEDRNLLVAAAGSGKTSTIVAKVGYALLTKHYQPADLLVLAFNNDAASELDQRIKSTLHSLLPNDTKVRCATFHALGLAIIANGRGKKPSVTRFASGSETESSRFLQTLIDELLSTDRAFGIAWLTFRALYSLPARPIEEFRSRREWEDYVRSIGDYKDGRRGFETLKGELVKSQGELAIANWLFAQGVPYEYERPYEHPTATEECRQYSPDFYFPDIGAYLEHYGIDRHGNVPPAFGDRYKASMEWKAALHAEHQTDLFTTTFAQFVDGSLFSTLRDELEKRGQQFRPVDLRDVLAKLDESQGPDLVPLLKSFLKHAKSNEIDRDTMNRRVPTTSQPQRARVFAQIFWKVFDAYQAKLKAAGEVDFEDMILQAAQLLEAGRAKHAYRLVLVDEFQDISQARARLLKALTKQVPECRFFAVGDDWQSVYRFAGADIDLFTNFSSHFGVTATNQLTATFRSNTGITNVASHFVQKNPKQLKKSIVARDKQQDAVVVLKRYANQDQQSTASLAALEELAQAHPSNGQTRPTVFLLARYWHQCPKQLESWRSRFKGKLDLSFKTVHSSKGLEADYVIILGLASGRFAFPSTIADDPLFELVMPMPETFEHAEERRLFYVALTRAKRRVYLLAHSAAPSPFIAELFSDNALRDHLQIEAPIGIVKEGAEECPQCGTGILLKKAGKFGDFFGCSNYPICRFTRNGNDRAGRRQ